MNPEREAIVARYCAERSVERRNDVVDAYRYLCARSARKFKRSHNERADLEQVAALGLIKAADHYRPEMQTPFEAYASIIIVGELMHWVRDHERLVRTPRSLVALERRYLSAWERLALQLEREPTPAEIAEALGVSLAHVHDVSVARRSETLPLPVDDGGEARDACSFLPDTGVGLALEDRVALAAALDALPLRARTIVLGTFGADLTQAEIGARLGLSQSSVSKILRRALSALEAQVA